MSCTLGSLLKIQLWGYTTKLLNPVTTPTLPVRKPVKVKFAMNSRLSLSIQSASSLFASNHKSMPSLNRNQELLVELLKQEWWWPWNSNQMRNSKTFIDRLKLEGERGRRAKNRVFIEREGGLVESLQGPWIWNKGFLWIAFYVLGFWRTRNTGVIIVKMPDKNVNYWKDGFIEFSQFNHQYKTYRILDHFSRPISI